MQVTLSPLRAEAQPRQHVWRDSQVEAQRRAVFALHHLVSTRWGKGLDSRVCRAIAVKCLGGLHKAGREAEAPGLEHPGGRLCQVGGKEIGSVFYVVLQREDASHPDAA